MMGNRGARGAKELDAFSRHWRTKIRWAPGELRKLKRAFSKRSRANGARAVRNEAGQT
jgi:hypothetical protein